ncbi:hypothetical protein MSAN_02403600 [Mycena sanguinolenta]|uniref:Uncharacterized protein n=1 Tax=Mycena sanguinolenta TaxID=230812 RepID=A0A8H6X3Y2_9AGAR|nr:hypothetical protein MSAN_02403600 [Mycena sanguinolenta]
MNNDNHDKYAHYGNYDPRYGLPWGSVWPGHPQQQQTSQQQPLFFPHYYVPKPGSRDVYPVQNPTPLPALHVPASNSTFWDGYSTAPALHVPALNPVARDMHPTRDPGPVPAAAVPAPKATRKPSGKAPKEAGEPKYSARNLLDIAQTAIDVQLFAAKYGEKGKKLSEFGAAVRKLGIPGSDGQLKARLMDLLTFHEDPAKAPAAIVKAIEGTNFAITLGAPLDLLAAQQRLYADKTDAEKEKMLKKAAEDKRGGEAIRNASLNRSRRTAAQRKAEESSDDDEVVVVNTPDTSAHVASAAALVPPAAAPVPAPDDVAPAVATPAAEPAPSAPDDAALIAATPAAEPAPPAPDDAAPIAFNPMALSVSSTPVAATIVSPPVTPQRVSSPMRAASWSPPAPGNLLDHQAEYDSDSEIEFVGHTLPPLAKSTNNVVIKAEPTPLTIPAPPTVAKTAPRRLKSETPIASIPRTSRKASTSKASTSKRAAKADDSDIENSPPSTGRKTKRIRRSDSSFDLQEFLLEERKNRTEFQASLLEQVRQSTVEFRKGAAHTQAFQTEFLGFLRDTFKN